MEHFRVNRVHQARTVNRIIPPFVCYADGERFHRLLPQRLVLFVLFFSTLQLMAPFQLVPQTHPLVKIFVRRDIFR